LIFLEVFYTEFVDKVVEFTNKHGRAGFDMAIEYCIKNGILEPYLKENSKEVRNMLTTEYNYETELNVVRREAREEGREEGVLNTATRMKNNSFDVPTIMKITGLSRETIEKL